MIVDHAGHKKVMLELSSLTEKSKLTKSEERRHASLLSFAASIRDGAYLRDLELDDTNETRQRYGIPVVQHSGLTVVQESRAKAFKGFLKGETRAMLEGNPTDRIGTYSGLGYFVPTGWLDRLYSALSAHDVLFNDDSVTVVRTNSGNPIPVPTLGDISVVAAVVGENNSRTPTVLGSTGQAKLGVYTYDSKPLQVSMEAAQDMVGSLSLMDWAESVFASRLARGIGADLVNGNGSGKPLGLIPALEAIGVNPITAVGSAPNTGGSESGAVSLGSQDFSNAIAALDSAYLESSKCAWIMNRRTLASLNFIVTKMGQPLELVQYVGKKPYIYGIPVKISPSMDDIGASKIPVVLGDLSFWITRLVNAGDGNAQVGLYKYQETTDVIEKGIIEVAAFTRAGGCLAYEDLGSPAPFVYIRNHS